MISGFTSTYVALWALVLFQGLLALALLRQLAELRRLVEQGSLSIGDRLPLGSVAPEFLSRDLHSGRRVSSEQLKGGERVLLFLSAECEVCKGLADSLQERATNGLPPIIAFCHGNEKRCRRFVPKLGLRIPLLLERALETARLYGVSGFPTAVIVDQEGKIRGYGHPSDAKHLGRLLAGSLAVSSGDGPEGELSLAFSKLSESQ